MMVLGADMHKGSHTVAAVAAATGELLGDRTVDVGHRGFAAALEWARGLNDERVWALEDCRHVSGAFERFLLVNGERVVRVAPRLMAGERRASRARGKSDRIDALAVARAALREGLKQLPVAELAGVEVEIRLLVDHRERLVRVRTALYNDLLWHLHDLWPEQTFPKSALLSKKWSAQIARRLARAEQTARARIARDELRHLRELSSTIDALEAEIADLVDQVAPHLLDEPGFGPLTAGKLIGEIAGAQRFSSDAKLARAGGLAPIPVSSGKTRPPPPRPRRQPPDQHRDSPRRRHPRAMPPRDPRLHRPQTRRRQKQHRSDPRPQAPPRPPHLAPAPRARPHDQALHRHQLLDIGAAKAAAPSSVAGVLPDELLARARPTPAGELYWSVDDAADVIRAVQSAGGRVHGFDLRRLHPSGGFMELPTYISGNEACNRDANEWALRVLRDEAEPTDLVTLTWDSPQD